MTAPHAIAVPEDLPKLVIAVETATVTEIVRLVTKAVACTTPTTPEHAEQARAVLVEIQKLKNRIEKERKTAQAPFKSITDQIMEAAKGAIQPLEQVQALLKEGIETFICRQHAANAAQQRAITQAHAQPAPDGRQTPALAVISAPPRPAAVSTYEDWDIELVDATLLPRLYLVPDMAAIKAAIKGGAQIPGVSATKVTRVAAR